MYNDINSYKYKMCVDRLSISDRLRLGFGMSAHVQSEVVRSTELTIAHPANVGLVARVL